MSASGLENPGYSSAGQIHWESKVLSKAKDMQKKTLEVRQRFSLPLTEQVVQDYYCSVHREKMNHGGRMWITQSYVVFYSGFPFHQSEKISFKDVTAIDIKKKGGLSNIIQLTVDEGKLGVRLATFGALLKPQETLAVLCYLWHNPPLYISLDSTDLHASVMPDSSSSAAPSANPYSQSGPSSSSSFVSPSGDGWGAYMGGPPPGASGGDGWMQRLSGQQQEQVLAVDTQTSAAALRTAIELREMGTETLQELSRQGEVIDQISNTVENIHVNMDRGDRILRGLESFGGGLKNTFTKDQTKGKNIVYERIQRTIHLKSRMPEMVDVTILLKKSDDSLSPVVLRFLTDHFECYDSTKQQVIKGLSWPYNSIEQVIMRARPLHIDVRFSKDTPRFRLLSSACQAITNELLLRSIGHRHEPEIVFEPNIPNFEYGSYKLCLVPSSKKDAAPSTNVYTAGTSQVMKSTQASAVLSRKADQQLKDDFNTQAQHVDGILDIAQDLQAIALTMGEELERSNAELERLAGRTGEAVHRVHHSNFRVKQML